MQFEETLSTAFRMEGYYVWCGSVIRGEDGHYHIFASRWKRENTFHPGWLTHSEVVRGESTSPFGPFEFKEVVLPARGPEFWDGCATHNPNILKYGKKYLLFYTGMSYPLKVTPQNRADVATVARASKRVGLAIADSVFGPWKRMDHPVIPVKPQSYYSFLTSNPAPAVEPDDSIFLLFKTRKYVGFENSTMFIGAARAKSPESPFEVLTPEPLFGEGAPNGEIEDPFLWIDEAGMYRMIAKDMRGDFCGTDADGIELVSTNGLNWKYAGKAYAKGKYALRERPFLLFDEKKKPLALFNAVADQYPYRDPAAQTWNAVAKVK